jgi:hypothetical protein
MPLSDEEARLLHQLEQSLAAEDPSFASTLRGSARMAQGRRAAVVAVLGFLTGLGVMFAGVVSQRTWLGVLGFLVMLAASYVFVMSGRRGLGGPTGVAGRPEAKASKRRGSLIERLDDRWQRRQRGHDF